MKGNGITLVDGLWWPTTDVVARKVITEEALEFVPWFLDNCPGRGTIVQAGANVGVYPLALSNHFKQVITVEPDHDNHRCAWLNAHGAYALTRAAFGEKRSTCRVVVHEEGNCGAHRVEPKGDVLVMTIDGLNLDDCDAIWLDVEGSELPALKGAIETIKRFHPVIATEEKGLGRFYSYENEDIGNWLAGLGYEQQSAKGPDRLYV